MGIASQCSAVSAHLVAHFGKLEIGTVRYS